MTIQKKAKYALHPGWIRSLNDEQAHYVSLGDLVKLYELKPGEYILWTGVGRRREDYIHLHPSYLGKYGRPNEN